MELKKDVYIGKIEIVTKFKHIQWQTKTDIIEDGVVISSTNHRRSVSPGDDYSHLPEEIQRLCNLYFTQELIDSYAAHLEKQAI